jgi:hypothetical protein
MLLPSTIITLILLLVASNGTCVNPNDNEEDAAIQSRQEMGQLPQHSQPSQHPQQLPHIIQQSLQQHRPQNLDLLAGHFLMFRLNSMFLRGEELSLNVALE